MTMGPSSKLNSLKKIDLNLCHEIYANYALKQTVMYYLSSMNSQKILIVEDEILIADNIARFLSKRGHEIVGNAISYEEAETLYLEQNPDIVLLDIKLSGAKTGIDFAHFIREQENPKPFIFLTSQVDSNNINKAKETFPAAYLAKPIQKDSLFATIEIVMHQQGNQERELETIPLYDGTKNHLINISDILYIEADHVYLQIHLANGKQIVHRNTLSDFINLLPENLFIQTHRSFVVNVKQVNSWDSKNILIKNIDIPISRSRKDIVLSMLKSA